MRTATCTILAIACAVIVGCGPRTTPDASLRPVPAAKEPTATINIDVRPLTYDSCGNFPWMATSALLPVVCLAGPGVGGKNVSSAVIPTAIRNEITAVKTARIVHSGGDYVLSGSAETRDTLFYHQSGLGFAYYLAILPYLCGLPNKSYHAEATADVTLRRTADGTTLIQRHYESAQVWQGNKYTADDTINQPSQRYRITADVHAREVAMEIARDVAAAIAADQAKP